jgi:Protein of unknown function (DUF1360)
MGEVGLFSRLILAILANWRVTHLLAHEDGPADLLARIRGVLNESSFGQLMDCFQCMSLWVAVPFAFYVNRRPLDWFVSWLAVSGAACLLERIGQDPLVIERVAEPTEGEPRDGMLRTDTRTTFENFNETETSKCFPSGS